MSLVPLRLFDQSIRIYSTRGWGCQKWEISCLIVHHDNGCCVGDLVAEWGGCGE